MAPNFQSSFIPKDPITEEVFKKKKAGVFGILAVSLFVASIIISLALFAYKNIIKGDIINLQSELASAEKNIDKKTIEEMSQFGKKLNVVKSIVFKHQVLLDLLNSIASSTVSSVYFTDFNTSVSQEKISVSMHGKALDYASIALQESILSQNKHFQSITFSNLDLTDEGRVSFELEISVLPQISFYSPIDTNINLKNE